MRYMCINKIKSGRRIMMYMNNDRCNIVTISMSADDMKRLEKKVRCLFEVAKKNMKQYCISLQESSNAISDVVPGYSAKTLHFGSYDKSEFIVLFIDMRNSTSRAMEVDPKHTFSHSNKIFFYKSCCYNKICMLVEYILFIIIRFKYLRLMWYKKS